MKNVFKSLGINKIVIASTNKIKIDQIKSLDFFAGIELLSSFDFNMKDVEETEDTLEGNSLLKARACYEYTGLPSLSDDTGVFVNALNGFPGIHCARLAEDSEGKRNYNYAAKIINDRLGNNPDRSCIFSSVVTFIADGIEYSARGDVLGTFVYPAMFGKDGSNGAYKPYFIPEHSSISYAQGGFAGKSHRMKAIQNLIQKMELSISEAS